MFNLKDKVALVTGASQGIGRETALALAEAGAKVAVAARNEEKLTTLVTEIVSRRRRRHRHQNGRSRPRPNQIRLQANSRKISAASTFSSTTPPSPATASPSA